MIVANAISLNMLPPDCTSGGIIFRRVTADEAQRLVREANEVASAIGHADTARLISQQLGVELPPDRRSVLLGDEPMLIAQYVGPRLPEGATELPLGARVEFFLVRLADMKELSWRRGEAMLYPLGSLGGR
jgi:hypothetical protein